jgi:hypothetical protein
MLALAAALFASGTELADRLGTSTASETRGALQVARKAHGPEAEFSRAGQDAGTLAEKQTSNPLGVRPPHGHLVPPASGVHARAAEPNQRLSRCQHADPSDRAPPSAGSC